MSPPKIVESSKPPERGKFDETVNNVCSVLASSKTETTKTT